MYNYGCRPIAAVHIHKDKLMITKFKILKKQSLGSTHFQFQ